MLKVQIFYENIQSKRCSSPDWMLQNCHILEIIDNKIQKDPWLVFRIRVNMFRNL